MADFMNVLDGVLAKSANAIDPSEERSETHVMDEDDEDEDEDDEDEDEDEDGNEEEFLFQVILLIITEAVQNFTNCCRKCLLQ
jgi:hypothetical protein